MGIKDKPVNRAARRQIGLTSLLAPAVSIRNPCMTREFSLADMIELSATLTQIPTSLIFLDIAKKLLGILQDRGLNARLLALKTNPDAHSELSNEIVEACYSGAVKTVTGRAVITYNNALLWQTTSFLYLAGNCGGPTNY